MNIAYNATAGRFDAFLARGDFWRAEYDLVKSNGFRFDKETYAWYTTDVVALRGLFKNKPASGITMTEEAVAEAKRLTAQKEAAVESSRATDAQVEIALPEGINSATGKPFAYLPYQRAGIAYAMARPHSLIADEMGLGKTIQAIGVSNADPTICRVLIICPATLKLNWRKEWLKWDIKHLEVGIAGKQFPTSDVVIINYDILKKYQAQLRNATWDLMVIDECHYLKEGKTARTQEVFGRKRARKRKVIRNGEKVEIEADPLSPIPARRRVFLTGTPIVNRPKEMWTLIQALDPHGLGAAWMKFALRYCGAVKLPFGWYFDGATNLEELQEKLRAAFMVRRLKKDVLKELPPKVREVVPLEIDGLTVRQRELLDEEKKLYVESEGGDAASPQFTELSRVRKEVALLKVEFVIELLKEMLDETEKIVVFAHHHEVVDKLAAAFGAQAVTIDGRVGNADRQAAVERFQSDSSCRVFIGSIAAAGVGITLTAASTVVFAELDWVPGNVSQAEDRCHRIGQEEQVLVKHLVLEGSLDDRMANILIEKQAIIDQALDAPKGETNGKQDSFGEATIAAALPANQPQADQPGDRVQQPASSDPARDSTPEFSDEQRDAIHLGLRILAGTCDGAEALDGHGFNKIDTVFGKRLAAASRLTPKMTAVGKQLVRKYRGQLPPALVEKAGVAA